ncbi:MAG: hypothetical protein CMD04_00855, partial [Flavobacteriales bacterium]|nr:hypothetical protein [Flavobacteriales bacterium]
MKGKKIIVLKSISSFLTSCILSALLIFFTFVFSLSADAQCLSPTGISETNISTSSVDLSWDLMSDVDYYRVSYRVPGGAWQFATNPINISSSVNSITLSGLQEYSTYDWRIRAWCLNGQVSPWTATQSFTTLSSQPLDCNGDQNGLAYIDSCGNCVGGNTGSVECISFSPTVSISLSSYEISALTSVTFVISQDSNEPDMSSSLITSNLGSFNLSSLSSGDIVGSGSGVAGGGFFSANYTLYVDFIISANQVTLKALDDSDGSLLGTFELENLSSGGVKILSIAPADDNNITAGNNQTVTLSNLFNNPSTPSTLEFYSSITSELGGLDNQLFSNSILAFDCNGDFGGSAYIDSCGNCVGGNTGNVECISFSPSTIVTLSDSSCNNLTDLSIIVSQDANEPDMSTSFFSSSSGSFDFSNMTLGQNIGVASLSAAGGDINFVANLFIISFPSSNSAIVSAINQTDGNVMGSFTISNNNPGIAIIANPSYNDGNNITGGNTSTVTFNNIFITPSINESLTFYSLINSEISTQSNETIDFGVLCPCPPSTSTTDVTACDSYDWNGTTYTNSGTYTFVTTNASGCDSTATLNLTINNASASTTDVTACD